MTSSRGVLAFTAIMVGGGLVFRTLRPVPSFEPSVQLPDGVSLAEILRSGKNETPKGWQTNKYCLGGRPAQDLIILAPRERASLLFESIRYKVHEMLGRTLARVPTSPRVDYVTPRLGECFGVSGEKYLYAKEFGLEVSPYKTEDDWKFLGFVWGGTNQLRHARDWTALIENGIRQNGIFGIRPNDGQLPIEILGPTNQCAIIRDTKGLVKILPLDCVKGYVDAGLVRLPVQSSKTQGQPHRQVPVGPNERPGADAGWRVLFAFGHAMRHITLGLSGAGPRVKSNRLTLLCLLLILVTVASGCATCGHSSAQAREDNGLDIWSDRSFWDWLLNNYGTH
jgi:hypothetical protein